MGCWGLRTFFLFLITAFLVSPFGGRGVFAQTTYTWTGTTSTSFTTSTNWSPIGVPGSADYVVIQSATNAPLLTANRTVGRFRINSGTMDLAGYTLTVNDKLELLGGITTAGKIVQSASNIANINNATVNCKLDLTATTVTFQYATCTDSVSVHQTTTTGTITWRGNKFYGHLKIENTSNGNMNLGYNPADSCFAGLTLVGRRIRAAYAHPGYYVQGDVSIDDQGPTGTSIALAGGDGTAAITVDGDVTVDKTGDGNLMFAVTSGTCQMIQTSGHSIYEGSTGYTTGPFQIMGLTQQGTGGGITLTAGSGTQVFRLTEGTYGPAVGSLQIDLDDAELLGATVKGQASVVADHLSVEDSDFLSALYLEKTGAVNDLDNGGNRYYGPLSVKLNGSADMHLAFTAHDTAFSSLQLISTGNNLVVGEYTPFVAMGSVYCNEQAGNIILGGSYGGDFTIAGNGVQTLALEQGNEVSASKVSVNKPSGHARLTGTMRVTGSLTLTNGVIHTVDTGLVVVADNATVTGAADNSHVEGPVLKEGNDAFSFPIGRNGIYQPLTISAPSTTAHTFRAEYFDEDSDPMHTHSSRDGSIAYLDRTQYWTYQRTAGTNNLYVTLGWRDVSCGIASINDPDVCAWNGTQWKNLGNSVPTGTTTTGTARTSKTTSVYGAYTWGNFSGIRANAGPDRVIVAGDTTNIGVEGNPDWDHGWTPTATVQDPDSAKTRAYPTTTTDYILEVTGENSCTAKDTATVFVTVLPEDTARSSLDFVVNNGQIIDTDGAPREDIGIYSHQASPMVYCADNRVSFVHAKIDTVAATPDTLARVDIHFHETFREAEPLGMGLNSHHYNYYYAHCPDGVTLTPSYNRVVYPELYENTDLHIKGNNSWMKFEFVIRPGGDPEDILMTFEGADNIMVIPIVDALVITSSIGTYVFPEPKALTIDTVGNTVELNWQPDWDLSVTGDTVRFTNIGSYDPEEVLIFTLGEDFVADIQHTSNPEWSTHYGGDGHDEGTDLSVDTEGNVYNCGFTDSQDFPSDFGANTGNFGGFDAYIARFGSATGASLGVVENGDRLQWSTYWGGSGDDKAFACTSTGTGTDGKTYITGITESLLLPENNGGSYVQPSVNGVSDALLIAIDNATGGTWQGYRWTTAFGGNGIDEGRAITTDASGNIYIAGSTSSPSYTANTCAVPTDGGFPKCNTSSTYSNIGSYGGGSTDGFIARFNPSGTLQWSTFYGGSDMDVINDLVFDGEGNLYITGETGSVSDFPTLSMSNLRSAVWWGGDRRIRGTVR